MKKCILSVVLAFSTLVSGVSGQAKSSYITFAQSDIDYYKETGRVVTFTAMYTRSPFDYIMRSAKSDSGYDYLNKEVADEWGLSAWTSIIDTTNSVKTMVFDGKTYKLDKVDKSWKEPQYVDYDGKTFPKRLYSSKLKKKKLTDGRHTYSIEDKYGHKSVYKYWVDTKLPKMKLKYMGSRVKITFSDRGTGLGEVSYYKNGHVVWKKWNKVGKKTYTVTISKKNLNKYGVEATDIVGNQADTIYK